MAQMMPPKFLRQPERQKSELQPVPSFWSKHLVSEPSTHCTAWTCSTMSDLEDDLSTENQVDAHAVVRQPRKLSRLLKKPQQAVQNEHRHPLADATNVAEGGHTQKDTPAVSQRPASDAGDTLADGRACLPHLSAINAGHWSMLHADALDAGAASSGQAADQELPSSQGAPGEYTDGQLEETLTAEQTQPAEQEHEADADYWWALCNHLSTNNGTACLLGWVGTALTSRQVTACLQGW